MIGLLNEQNYSDLRRVRVEKSKTITSVFKNVSHFAFSSLTNSDTSYSVVKSAVSSRDVLCLKQRFWSTSGSKVTRDNSVVKIVS